MWKYSPKRTDGKTDRLAPNSTLPPNSDTAVPNIALFALLSTRVAIVRNEFYLIIYLFLRLARHTRAIKRGGLDCYIRSKQLDNWSDRQTDGSQENRCTDECGVTCVHLPQKFRTYTRTEQCCSYSKLFTVALCALTSTRTTFRSNTVVSGFDCLTQDKKTNTLWNNLPSSVLEEFRCQTVVRKSSVCWRHVPLWKTF
jgi:hypothetical protein